MSTSVPPVDSSWLSGRLTALRLTWFESSYRHDPQADGQIAKICPLSGQDEDWRVS